MRRMITGAAGFAATLLVLALAPTAARAAEAEPFKMMSLDEVQAGVAAKNLAVFDANSPETYAKGHVPGAKLIAYRTFTEAELPSDKSARLVFYCSNTH